MSTRIPLLLIFLAADFHAIGCGGPPRVRTTFLNSVDLIGMTDQMAQSFAGDDRIAARTPDDDRWVISIYRVVNHTNQIIADREKWLYINRLRGLLGRSSIAEDHNIVWIIPPERWGIIAAETGEPEPHGLRLNPTHQLTAQFSALTNTSGRGRSDTYLCSYELFELSSGRVIWADAWEVKRSISGLTYD